MPVEIIKTKKSIWKSWKFYVPLAIVLLLIVGFAYASYRKNNQAPVYNTVKVERGDLKQSVEATGQIESVNALALRLETSGTLEAVKVKEGDKVRAGALLANLRLGELNAAVMQADANLNQKLAGATTEYIAQLEAALDKAKADLASAEGAVPGVETSKLVQDAYDDALANLQSVQVIISSALTAADNILGVDNVFANDTFESLLSTIYPDKLTLAKAKYLNVKLLKNNFDSAINILNKNASHTEIDQALEQSKDIMLSMKDLLFLVSGVLDNTLPGNNLSSSALDTLKSNIQTVRTSIANKYVVLVDEEHAIETARSSYFSYEALVTKAIAALKDAQNPPREVDVAYYRATLAAAAASRDKAILRAPIDGVIAKVNKKRGEFVSSADVVVEMLSPHYEIKVDIPETDVSKLKVNDAVSITLDAFGDDVKFSGKIVSIDPASTEVQDVVYYKVQISLDDTDKPIKHGMTANVVIATASVSNALLIPSRAIRANETGEKYVRVLMNGQEIQKPVRVGLKGDGGQVEIISGLNVDDEIIVSVKTSI